MRSKSRYLRMGWVLTVPLLAAIAMLAPPTAAQDVRQEKPQQAQAACPDCKARLDASGWCEACGQGIAQGVKTKCKSCLAAIQRDGWCDDCEVGYVGAEKTSCMSCYAAAASTEGGWCAECGVGHARGLKTKCESCFAAIRSDGWCEGCDVGYAGGLKTACKGCFAAMSTPAGGWCDDCQVGYGRGVKTKCKSCLQALREDGWCEDCQVGYVAGSKSACEGCFGLMSKPAGGWCPDCAVGHAKGLKTECKTCFAAMGTNSVCEGCGIRFQDGRSFQKLALHVHGLEAEGADKEVREILAAQAGLSGVELDSASGTVRFELETTNYRSAADVVLALVQKGFEAHEVAQG